MVEIQILPNKALSLTPRRNKREKKKDLSEEVKSPKRPYHHNKTRKNKASMSSTSETPRALHVNEH